MTKRPSETTRNFHTNSDTQLTQEQQHKYNSDDDLSEHTKTRLKNKK